MTTTTITRKGRGRTGAGLLFLAGTLSGVLPGAASIVPANPTDTNLLEIGGDAVPKWVKGNNTKLRIVPGIGGKQSGQALEVPLSARHKHAGISFRPAKPWDWSDKGDFSLAIDIANTGKHSVQLYVNIADRHGASQVRTAVIPTGGTAQTYYLVLAGEELKIDSGLRSDPPASNPGGSKCIWLWGAKTVDVAAISKFSLHTDTNIHDRRIVVGNLRLFRNPEMDPDFLTGVVDEFGQNKNADYPYKVKSEADLKARAKKELAALANSGPMPDRSKFGGWKNGPRLKATGYFRTEKVGGKWAMVDPEGYLYFATGIANARMANTTTLTGVDFREPTVRKADPEGVTPDDSMPFIETSDGARKTRFIASELRHKMFTWLPEYDSPYGDHYHYKRGAHTGPLKHGESFSFYQANLERKYGQTAPGSYLERWRDVTVDRMLDWGFTSMGNWADAMFFQVDRIPYFANGWIIGNFKTVSSGNDFWAPLPDPFDPEFVRRTKVTVKAIAADVEDSPWCVGVFIDNEKSWGRMGSFESQYGIVIHTLARDAAGCPTKAVWVGMLKERYPDIAALNAAWTTSFDSWDALAKKAVVSARNAAVKKDFAALLSAFANEYFRVVSNALDEVMPNHLYMGARMAHWGMTPEVVGAAKKYSDVVSYNLYKEGLRDADWAFLKEIDKPSIIGEFHMGSTSDTGLYHPGLIIAQDQADRGRMFQDYMKTVIDNPYFVGAHWFQYIDSPLTGRAYDGENYNVGFVTVADVPYRELVEAAREVNRGLYERRFGDLKNGK